MTNNPYNGNVAGSQPEFSFHFKSTSGKILYNHAQQDMVALRCVMRLGWHLPNPVTATNSDENSRYPFEDTRPDNERKAYAAEQAQRKLPTVSRCQGSPTERRT